MRPPSTRAARTGGACRPAARDGLRDATRGALALAALAMWAACSAFDEGGAPAAGLVEPCAPYERLGRIHVAIQAPSDTASDVPALEISARFVEYRGLEAAAVRQRVDLPPLAIDRLRVGACSAGDALWSDEPPASREPGTSREIALIDVGNLAVTIGEASVEVPLSLVPDILPYMSGVVYDHASEALPASAGDRIAPHPIWSLRVWFAAAHNEHPERSSTIKKERRENQHISQLVETARKHQQAGPDALHPERRIGRMVFRVYFRGAGKKQTVFGHRIIHARRHQEVALCSPAS